MEQPSTPQNAGSSGLRVLVASSEAHPLIKTGGLADVAGSLPCALRELGSDARLIIPAYPQAVKQVRELKTICELKIAGSRRPVRLLSGRLPDSEVPTYLVNAPEHFCREGNPYADVSARDWGDNPERFLLFCRVIAQVGMGVPALDWRPQVIHCNDWQTGLTPALLRDEPGRPALVFTIHNLAYQGLFDRATFDRLRLPARFWAVDGLEFHNLMSFIKGGVVYSDYVNTVSPTYALEVRTPRFGCGLDGLLRKLGEERFRGILNGIDYTVWNPAEDEHISQPYDRDRFELKIENKLALQREFGLPRNERSFVVGYIGRLVEQKGVDLILEVLPRLLERPDTQLIMQGAGNPGMEERLLSTALSHAEKVGVFIGYDEGRAHRVEAGCDAFLMPSRFEPCGLNQLYSLRYGTVPIVHRTGGLADTVFHADEGRIDAGEATGFTFDEANGDGLWHALHQALTMYRERPDLWRRLALTGMDADHSWQSSARRYVGLYHDALAVAYDQHTT